MKKKKRTRRGKTDRADRTAKARRIERKTKALLERVLGPREQQIKAWKKVQGSEAHWQRQDSSRRQRRADRLHGSLPFRKSLDVIRKKWLRKSFTPITVKGARLDEPPQTGPQTKHGTLTSPDAFREALSLLKRVRLKHSAFGARIAEYERDLEQLRFGLRLPVWWRDYLEACLFFNRPPVHFLSNLPMVKIRSVTYPNGIAPGVYPFPVKASVQLEGVETEDEREHVIDLVRHTNKYLRLKRPMQLRSTFVGKRHERIRQLLEENARRKPSERKGRTKLYREFGERYPDDLEITLGAFDSIIKRDGLSSLL